jgi:hypothetical protein
MAGTAAAPRTCPHPALPTRLRRVTGWESSADGRPALCDRQDVGDQPDGHVLGPDEARQGPASAQLPVTLISSARSAPPPRVVIASLASTRTTRTPEITDAEVTQVRTGAPPQSVTLIADVETSPPARLPPVLTVRRRQSAPSRCAAAFPIFAIPPSRTGVFGIRRILALLNWPGGMGWLGRRMRSGDIAVSRESRPGTTIPGTGR